MTGGKYLKGRCQHCDGPVEFPAEAVGTTADCPHCGQPTELFLVVPEQESAVPKRTIVLTAVTVIILVGGLVWVLVALKRAQRLADRSKITTVTTTAPPVAAVTQQPLAQAGFQSSSVRLEKTQGSSLVYAIGSIRNETDRRRFGVKVELELLDDAGNVIGTAKDYQSTLEPGAEWRFKALVVESKAVAAKIASIKEDQ